MLEVFKKARATPNVPVESSGKQTGCSMEVQTTALAVEIMDPLVPDVPARRGQKRSQFPSIDRSVSVNASLPEHREKIAMLQGAKCGKFQFEERRLMRVKIDAIDTF